MTEQETINNDVQMKLALQDVKFAAFMDEMKDFKTEMREQNKMRAAEMAELRQSIEEINKSTDAKIASIDAKIDSTNKHIRNLSYTSIAAIAAMVITVLLNLPK